jgi:hypothetical protein
MTKFMCEIDDWSQRQLDAARAAGLDAQYSPNCGQAFREWCAFRSMIVAEQAAKSSDSPALARKESVPDLGDRYRRAYRLNELTLKSEEPGPTAVHEAGHGVIARVLGLGCEKIVMRKRGGGFAVIEKPPSAAARLGVFEASRRNAIASWAGGLASEAMGSEPSAVDLAHIGACGDIVGADLKTRTGWRDEAVHLVEKHRTQIDRVARALEALRELLQSDIDALIGSTA